MTDSAKRDFSSEAGTWDDNPARLEMAINIVDAIISRVPLSPDMHVLDYGAGTGLVTLGLQPYVGSILAADSAPGMLAVLNEKITASRLANVDTILLDLEHDARNECFDLIVSAMTMHHIERVPEMICTLAGMLRPGGHLAIADLDLDNGEFHTDPAGVRHHGFDRDEILRLFADSGLTEVTVETAHTLGKEVPGKGRRDFTVFLAVGRKIGH